MSPGAWQERFEDILNGARTIRDFAEGMSFDTFLDNPRTIRAVDYEFTTLREAACTIPLILALEKMIQSNQ